MAVFEPSLALRIRTETRASTVPGGGTGVFALEDIPKGQFLGMDFLDPQAVSSAEELAIQPTASGDSPGVTSSTSTLPRCRSASRRIS